MYLPQAHQGHYVWPMLPVPLKPYRRATGHGEAGTGANLLLDHSTPVQQPEAGAKGSKGANTRHERLHW